MTQAVVSVVLFIVLLALLPLAIRWVQRRQPGGATAGAASRIISALSVGPQQRVVTVEIGPEDARTWLVLGITAQNITCLHSIPVVQTPARSSVFAPAPDAAATGAGDAA